MTTPQRRAPTTLPNHHPRPPRPDGSDTTGRCAEKKLHELGAAEKAEALAAALRCDFSSYNASRLVR